MDTEFQIPDSIDRLLRSKIIEDIIIGISYIYSKYGKDGIEKTLDRCYTVSMHNANYVTNIEEFKTFIIYDDIIVWIGPGWIEYDRPMETVTHAGPITIINNKTQ